MPISNSPLTPGSTLASLLSLQSGYGWSPTGSSGNFSTYGQAINLTYAFPTTGADYGANYGDELTGRVSALSASQQQVALNALQSWSNVANITLSAGNPTNASLRFMFTTGTFEAPSSGSYTVAYAYFPNGQYQSGDMWLNGHLYNTDFSGGPTIGSNGWSTIVHEVGHALGIKHPFEGTYQLPIAYDSKYFTIMSYSSYPGQYLPNNSGGGSFLPGTLSFEPTGPMLYDIAAIQAMYGANYSHNSGNTIYTFATNRNYFETIWDGGGIDTIAQGAGAFVDAIIDLREGAFSRLGAGSVSLSGANAGFDTTRSVAIAFGAVIENATGAEGFDQIQGNAAANVLIGNGGYDLIYGDANSDTVQGGTGNDTLYGDSGYDSIDGGNDRDLVFAGSENDYVLGGQGNDTLHGDSGDDYVDGGLDNDDAYGGIGNDTLVGAGGSDHLLGGAGDDVLAGGIDDDWLEGEGGNDVIYGEDGNDLITTAALGQATVYGGAGNDSVTTYGRASVYLGSGNNSVSTSAAGAVYIVAEAGVDTFTLRGTDTVTAGDGNDIINLYGAGATVYGGAGNDVYNVYAAGDIVFEATGQGIDTVYNYGASANLGAGVENYYAWSINAVSAFGNELNNLMYGNAVQNALNGGAGNDQLVGGGGNDFLLETDGVDVLFGEDGDDWLDGAFLNDALIGGAGNDQLFGGFGNDVIFGDSATSINTVNGVVLSNPTATSATSAAQTWLTGAQTGSAWGNDVIDYIDGADWLWGQYGDDIMLGGGGKDVLFGGDGADLIYGDSSSPVAEGGVYSTQPNGVRTASGFFSNDLSDVLSGDNGHDTLIGGQSTDFLFGGDGDDLIFGYLSRLPPTVIGGNSAVPASSLTRGDLLFGGSGNDILVGSNEVFTIGTETRDQFWGGNGADIFVLGEALISGTSGNTFATNVSPYSGITELLPRTNVQLASGGSWSFSGAVNTIADFEDGIDKIFLGSNLSQIGLPSSGYIPIRQLNFSNGSNAVGYNYAFNGEGAAWTTDKTKIFTVSDNFNGSLVCTYGDITANGGDQGWFILAHLVGVNPNLIDSTDFIFG